MWTGSWKRWNPSFVNKNIKKPALQHYDLADEYYCADMVKITVTVQESRLIIMLKGRLFLFISAVTYGVIPCLSAIAYRGGLNGVTLTFLRSCISLPFLYLVIRMEKRLLKLTYKRLKQVLILGFFGGTMPILLLYLSYQYIPTGTATALHFIYPVVVVAALALIYRQRLPRTTVSAVLLITAGVYMLTELNSLPDPSGAALALISGFFYSFYIIYMNLSGLDKEDHVVLSFYITLIMSVSALIFGVSSGALYLVFSFRSWCLAAVISFAVTFCAMPLFQLGIRYCGAAEAGIFSALEPVTSLVLGALVLGEYKSYSGFIGAVFIILGVLLVQRRNIGLLLSR